jgi:hypothetical protein
MNEALQMVQQGISLAGPKTEKYLKALESQADKFATAGGSASQYFAVVTSGFRDSTDWEKEIEKGAKATTQTFDSLVGQMSEGQQLQQQLVNSTAAFNTELASLFEGSGDLVDSLKVSFYDFATGALRTVKTSVVGILNYFIDLYNESLAFRLIVQGVIVVFKSLWEIVKAVTSTLVNGFSTFGDIVKAIFTGHWGDIPQIIAKSIDSQIEIFKEAGTNMYAAVKDGFESALHNKPIELIDVNTVLAPTKATNQVSQSSKNRTVIPTTDHSRGLETSLKPLTSASDAFAKTQKVLNDRVLADLADQRAAYVSLGDQIAQSLGVDAVNAIGAMGNALAGTQGAFKSLVGSALESIAKIIDGFLAQAIAATIAKDAALPGIGLFVAAAGATAIAALFKSKVPAFANGTDFAPGGLSLVGERGVELLNVPRGSQISPNKQTEALLSGNGGQLRISVDTIRLKGEDLLITLKQAQNNRDR